MTRYVVAVPREYRESGVSAERVRDVPGIEVMGASNPNRLLVEAEPSAIAEIKRRFGKRLRVEREIIHRRLAG